jgi:hypothetical protein
MKGDLLTKALLGIATCISSYAVALLPDEPAIASSSCRINTGCMVALGDGYYSGVCNSVATGGNCLCYISYLPNPLTPSPANACSTP